MARRSGLVGALAQIQRDIERSNRDRERAQRAAIQAQERAHREAERASAAADRARNAEERERKRYYQEARQAEVDAMNADLEAAMSDLASILADTLAVDDYLDFEALKERFNPRALDPGLLAAPTPVPSKPLPMPPLGAFTRLRKSAVEQRASAEAQRDAEYRQAVAQYEGAEAARLARVAEAERSHAAEQAAEAARVESHNAEIDVFRAEFEAGDPDAIAAYFGLVLQGSSYPEGFPRHSRVAFVPDSRQLVVEIDLPGIATVPAVKAFRYVKARDEITESARSQAEIRATYLRVVAEMSLRTAHEVFEADRGRHVDTLVLNAHVEAINPATGQPIRPCLLSLRTTRDAFLALSLEHVEPLACLRALNASVSSKPTELVPVRPVLEFSMVDPRFVEETDVLSELDQRTNLMELTPTEFEGLISNLFQRMGLETRQTRPSRDGGVDCVAFDPRPIFGGKVVIQAKRYRNTVGVSAVRDLFGTLQNEGASKGILVTTSGFGQASFEFAEGKPIELLSGAHLLHLLAEHAGIEAKIEPPDDWLDPPVPN